MFRLKSLWKQIFISLILNWVIGPFVGLSRLATARLLISQVMLGIAWATLPDLPTYRTGVIMVGLARYALITLSAFLLTTDVLPWS